MEKVTRYFLCIRIFFSKFLFWIFAKLIIKHILVRNESYCIIFYSISIKLTQWEHNQTKKTCDVRHFTTSRVSSRRTPWLFSSKRTWPRVFSRPYNLTMTSCAAIFVKTTEYINPKLPLPLLPVQRSVNRKQTMQLRRSSSVYSLMLIILSHAAAAQWMIQLEAKS